MTLQSSGAISLSQVNTELGLSSTATISLGDSAVRTLAGVSSGAISLSSLYGKSNATGTFSPDGGTSSGSPVALSDEQTGLPASLTISCSASATWTWTRTSSVGSASVASGGSATSITFSVTLPPSGSRTGTWTVSATSGGNTRYWTVSVTSFASGA